MDELYYGVVILVLLTLFVASLRYDWQRKIREQVEGKSNWEEVFYIYDHNQFPSPKKQNTNGVNYLSHEVILIDDNNLLHVGCYNYKNQQWELFTPGDLNGPIKWMYKPKALSF